MKSPDGNRPPHVYSMVEVELGDYRYRVRSAGRNGDPLVILLHGFPQTSRCWDAQIGPLANAGFHVLAPDQRGYSPGARPGQVEAYSMDHLVEDVLRLAGHFANEHIHLVGHDWGAAVSWQLAGYFPERVASLAIIGVHPPPVFNRLWQGELLNEQQRAFMAQHLPDWQAPDFEHTLAANDGALLRQLFTGLAPKIASLHVRDMVDVEVMRAALNWYRANPEGVPDAPSACAPVLFIFPTGEPLASRAALDLLTEHVAGPLQIRVFEGVGHWVPEQASQKLNDVLVSHLKQHTR